MCTRSGFFVGNRAVSVLLGLLHDSNPGRIFQRSYRRRHRYSCCGGRLDAGYFLDSRLHVHVFEQLVSFNSSHRISSLDGMSSRCVMLLKLLKCSIEFECSVVFTSRVFFAVHLKPHIPVPHSTSRPTVKRTWPSTYAVVYEYTALVLCCCVFEYF